MKRYSYKQQGFIENPKIDAFIADILKVSEKHGLSIEHEDSHGAFEVTNFNAEASQWLSAASDKT